MSVNQSRTEKNKPSQYRKSGRSGNSGQQKNSQGTGKGGGGNTAPPSSSLSSSRSFKKSNNAQGGQPRVSGGIVNSDSNKASNSRVVQNGAFTQPHLPGGSNAPVTGISAKPNDSSVQKNVRGVPKSPSSGVSPVSSETVRPLTPGKGLGDASRSLPHQFGSIRPDFINGMQVPAQTILAPPNFDEQKRDQAQSLKHASQTISPQQLPKKDVGPVDQSTYVESHPTPKDKKDVHGLVGPAVTQIPKHSVHPTSGISMQVPFHQPLVPPVQFGSPNPQIQGQSLTKTSPSIPIPMPVPLNPSQVQQPVFVPGLQPHHPLRSQGIIHQGQNLNFSSQIGPPQMPQLGNLGISIGPQFQQQLQAGKFALPRKTTVKITHPDTHEELRLDKRVEPYMETGSPGAPRLPRHMPPHTQLPIPSYPINCYGNSYNPNSLFFPPQSSLLLTSTQVTASPQAPRFFNQSSQGPPPVAFMNPPLNSFTTNKVGVPFDLSVLEHGRDGHNALSLPQPASILVTVEESKSNDIHKHSNFDASRSGGVGIKEIAAIGRGTSNQETPIVSVTSVSGGTESNSNGLSSPSYPKDNKPLVEITKGSKNTMGKWKKKKKEILQKADAAGTTFDLYNAYKGPEEKKATSADNTVTEAAITSKSLPHVSSVVPNKKISQSKAELDDWEDWEDISTPKLVSPNNDGKQNREVSAKKYSRDFLLKFSEHCISFPEGSQITPDTAEAFVVNLSRDYPNTGRIYDRPKPLVKTTKGSKNTMGISKKKKKKLFLQNADAAGTTFELYNAYKGPEEKKATSADNTVTEAAITSKSLPHVSSVVPNKKISQSKAELDDWEDWEDISTPKLVSPNNDGKQNREVSAKKYSRDFLLKLSEHCISFPEGFQITPDTAEAFVVNLSRDYPNTGRIYDRPIGGSRLDRRGSGMMGGGDDDKWNKMGGPNFPGRDMRLDIGYGGNVVGIRPGQSGNYGVLRGPRGQVSSVQYPGGILSEPMQYLGPMQRNSADSDRWQCATGYQKDLLPSPHTPLQLMHKAEKKYEVGKIIDEEQVIQRQLKGILNKLTPQNFEKLFEQVKQVNIDNAHYTKTSIL